jgi:hypothetical protein
MKLLAIPLLIAAVGSSLFSSLIPASAQTWTQTSAPITNWTAIASSADGVKLVAVASGGAIYTSTNSGASWAPATNAPDQAWRAVASSADGNKLIAAVRGGGIYRSVDSGLTWTQTGASSNAWISITSSADGNKLAAVASIFPPPDFFTSSDSGTTWITNGSPYDRWLAIAASADGNTLVACGGLGTILASNQRGQLLDDKRHRWRNLVVSRLIGGWKQVGGNWNRGWRRKNLPVDQFGACLDSNQRAVRRPCCFIGGWDQIGGGKFCQLFQQFSHLRLNGFRGDLDDQFSTRNKLLDGGGFLGRRGQTGSHRQRARWRRHLDFANRAGTTNEHHTG